MDMSQHTLQNDSLEFFIRRHIMLARRFSLVMGFMLVVLLLGVVPAKAEKRTSFTVTQMDWISYQESNGRTVGNNYMYDATTIIRVTSTDERYQGVFRTDFKCQAPLSSPVNRWGACEGNFTTDTDDDGLPEWVGTNHQLPQTTGGVNVAEYNGHGVNEYAGLQIKMSAVYDIAADTLTVTGEIFDPKGN
jgi:hypothetical protein